jgi:hypothetical protein
MVVNTATPAVTAVVGNEAVEDLEVAVGQDGSAACVVVPALDRDSLEEETGPGMN